MTYHCPHCGWRYDPAQRGHGFGLVPEHAPLFEGRIDFDAAECQGSDQNPRNAETDRRRLWNGRLPGDVWAEQDAVIAAQKDTAP